MKLKVIKESLKEEILLEDAKNKQKTFYTNEPTYSASEIIKSIQRSFSTGILENINFDYDGRGWITSTGEIISTNNAPHYEKEHKIKNSENNVKYNFGYERYIGLPKNRLSFAQYETLTKLLDYFFINKPNVGIRSTAIEINYDMNDKDDFKWKLFSPKTHTTDDIIKLIKRYYTTGRLNESSSNKSNGDMQGIVEAFVMKKKNKENIGKDKEGEKANDDWLKKILRRYEEQRVTKIELENKRNDNGFYYAKVFMNGVYSWSASVQFETWDDAVSFVKEMARTHNLSVEQKGSNFTANEEVDYLSEAYLEKLYNEKYEDENGGMEAEDFTVQLLDEVRDSGMYNILIEKDFGDGDTETVDDLTVFLDSKLTDIIEPKKEPTKVSKKHLKYTDDEYEWYVEYHIFENDDRYEEDKSVSILLNTKDEATAIYLFELELENEYDLYPGDFEITEISPQFDLEEALEEPTTVVKSKDYYWFGTPEGSEVFEEEFPQFPEEYAEFAYEITPENKSSGLKEGDTVNWEIADDFYNDSETGLPSIKQAKILMIEKDGDLLLLVGKEKSKDESLNEQIKRSKPGLNESLRVDFALESSSNDDVADLFVWLSDDHELTDEEIDSVEEEAHKYILENNEFYNDYEKVYLHFIIGSDGEEVYFVPIYHREELGGFGESVTKTFRIYDIDYDVTEKDLLDDDTIDDVLSILPKELITTVDIDEDTDLDDVLVDFISDETGWLVNGFEYDEIVTESKSLKESEGFALADKQEPILTKHPGLNVKEINTGSKGFKEVFEYEYKGQHIWRDYGERKWHVGSAENPDITGKLIDCIQYINKLVDKRKEEETNETLVKDRNELSKVVEKLKKENKKFTVTKSLKEGYRYSVKLVEESFPNILIDAIQYSFDCSKERAIERAKKMSDETKEMMIKGFKDNAKKDFNEAVEPSTPASDLEGLKAELKKLAGLSMKELNKALNGRNFEAENEELFDFDFGEHLTGTIIVRKNGNIVLSRYLDVWNDSDEIEIVLPKDIIITRSKGTNEKPLEEEKDDEDERDDFDDIETPNKEDLTPIDELDVELPEAESEEEVIEIEGNVEEGISHITLDLISSKFTEISNLKSIIKTLEIEEADESVISSYQAVLDETYVQIGLLQTTLEEVDPEVTDSIDNAEQVPDVVKELTDTEVEDIIADVEEEPEEESKKEKSKSKKDKKEKVVEESLDNVEVFETTVNIEHPADAKNKELVMNAFMDWLDDLDGSFITEDDIVSFEVSSDAVEESDEGLFLVPVKVKVKKEALWKNKIRHIHY